MVLLLLNSSKYILKQNIYLPNHRRHLQPTSSWTLVSMTIIFSEQPSNRFVTSSTKKTNSASSIADQRFRFKHISIWILMLIYDFDLIWLYIFFVHNCVRMIKVELDKLKAYPIFAVVFRSLFCFVFTSGSESFHKLHNQRWK